MTQRDIHAEMYGRGGGTREQLAVPQAEFRSYYGRQILKTPAWNWMIAAYLFLARTVRRVRRCWPPGRT